MYFIIYEDEHVYRNFQPAYYYKVAKRRVDQLSVKLKLPIKNFRIEKVI